MSTCGPRRYPALALYLQHSIAAEGDGNSEIAHVVEQPTERSVPYLALPTPLWHQLLLLKPHLSEIQMAVHCCHLIQNSKPCNKVPHLQKAMKELVIVSHIFSLPIDRISTKDGPDYPTLLISQDQNILEQISHVLVTRGW